MDTMTRRQVLGSLAALAPAALVPVSRAGAQPPAAPPVPPPA